MSYITIPVLRGFEKIERLFKLVSENNLGFVAGGYGRWMCSPKKEPFEARDVDIFCTSQEAYNKLVQIFTHQEKLKVKHESDISITYQTKNNEIWKDCPIINLIKPRKKNQLLTYGETLETVLENFDFSICKVGILNDKECLADYNFLEDEKAGKIRICKMESPVACLVRLCKYAKKGYKIPATQILDVLQEWDNRGQEYKDKLYKKLDELRENGGKRPRFYVGWPWYPEVNSNGSTKLPTASKDELSEMEESSRHEMLMAKQDTESYDDISDEAIDLYELIRCG